jgi:ABC-2 type transport system permease protein
VVAHLLRLKLLLLRNGLRRGVAAIVGMVFGVLYGGFLLVLALSGLVALRVAGDPERVTWAVVLGGALLTAGWTLLPLLFFGADPTLDPARFATYAVPRRTLAVGLGLAALVGLPGLATVLLGLGVVVATSLSPGSVLVALVAVPLGVAACVLLSRVVTAATAHLLSTRRGRDLTGVGVLVLLVGVGPALALASDRGIGPETVRRAADLAAWTPLAWPWTAAARAADGRWGPALLALVLAAVWAGVLFVLWERLLDASLRNPTGRASESGGQRGLGLLGRLPGTPLGAIAARSGTYWVRDPRFNVPALMTMLLPAGLLIPGIGQHSHLALVVMPVASAHLIGWGQHNDVGYDSTAFWMHVAAGVDGVADRLGRLFPSVVMAVVCVPVYCLLGPLVGLPWRLLPATVGVSTAFVLNGFAVACVASAVKQYAVPQPGENPFTARPGASGLVLAVQAVCGAAVVTLSLPALALGVLAWFGWAWAAWAALVVGPALGGAALWLGARLGGQLFERRQALLLQDLVSMR